MSLSTQESFITPFPRLNTTDAQNYSNMIARNSAIVNSQPPIKRQYTVSQANEIPFFRTDDAKGGFLAQQLQPFNPSLVPKVVGNLFIEQHRLINRQLNPFLSAGDLNTDNIGRQF